jgi:hypothetical protein
MSRLLISFFVVFFSLQVHSRPLNNQEQLSVANYQQAMNIMGYMVQEIDPRLLTFRQRLGFEVTKRACTPVKSLVDRIEAVEVIEDQSQNLFRLMYACLSGVVNVTDLYRLQSLSQ